MQARHLEYAVILSWSPSCLSTIIVPDLCVGHLIELDQQQRNLHRIVGVFGIERRAPQIRMYGDPGDARGDEAVK